MSRVIIFPRGSKRRMKQIRWKISEVISVVTLSLILLGLGVLFALWEVSHQLAEPKLPRRSKALTHNASPNCHQSIGKPHAIFNL